jgi:hypothetical protein
VGAANRNAQIVGAAARQNVELTTSESALLVVAFLRRAGRILTDDAVESSGCTTKSTTLHSTWKIHAWPQIGRVQQRPDATERGAAFSSTRTVENG